MANFDDATVRAMQLAAATGLRSMVGPAMLAAAADAPHKQDLALAALGEVILDKVPMMPGRDSLPVMLQRAVAGYYVANKSLERSGQSSLWGGLLGAAVAAGVGTLAPKLRRTLNTMGVPGLVLGLAEDYLALSLAAQAVNVPIGGLPQATGLTSFGEVSEHLGHATSRLMTSGR